MVVATNSAELAAQGITEMKCDNGNGLYVTRWTKKESTNCSKTKKPIKYKDQYVTCTCSPSETAYHMEASGCPNGHVLHHRVLHEPLPPRNDSCLRCMRSLQKEMSVKWCIECNAAFCPEGCDIKRID